MTYKDWGIIDLVLRGIVAEICFRYCWYLYDRIGTKIEWGETWELDVDYIADDFFPLVFICIFDESTQIDFSCCDFFTDCKDSPKLIIAILSLSYICSKLPIHQSSISIISPKF